MIALDTAPIIWSIRKECTPSDRDRMEDAQSLLFELLENKQEIGIPAPVMTEVLQGCKSDRRKKLLAELLREFEVLDYDAAAASVAAELEWKRVYDTRPRRGTDDPTRPEIKVDAMIIATAIRYRASKIYVADRDFKHYSDLAYKRGLKVATIPKRERLLFQMDELELPREPASDQAM